VGLHSAVGPIGTSRSAAPAAAVGP